MSSDNFFTLVHELLDSPSYVWFFRQMVAYCCMNVAQKAHALRVATVREKSLENEIFSRSGKNQGISLSVREILKK